MKKKTLILGASTNPERYAYLAAERLQAHQHPFVPVGLKEGEVLGERIITGRQELPQDIDTVTLYVGSARLPEWFDYILNIKPKRIIFNPGTENEELMHLAEAAGIEVVVGCTLVMLGSRQY
jgi:predicted CoA-binding protein